ncbi:MAG: GNAT family N-acetyltransferase [Methanosarcinaceae archaeon]|nr:GNAT family N-acetyltransferase [Methanosarcinaceae archaeon]MDD4496874.1 GNAT family N-acetyltransferase [Methanosarcinaceae archaeon]
MIIRKYDSSKKAEVRDLVLDVLLEHGFEYDRLKDGDLRDIEAYYFEKGGTFFVGLAEDGRVVGTAAVRNINGLRCEIRRIYLKKEFRGKGHGKELFLAALTFAEKNFSSVVLKTDTTLTKAIDMYLKHGFTFLKEEKGYLYFEKQFEKPE